MSALNGQLAPSNSDQSEQSAPSPLKREEESTTVGGSLSNAAKDVVEEEEEEKLKVIPEEVLGVGAEEGEAEGGREGGGLGDECLTTV